MYQLAIGKTPTPYLESYWNRIQLPTFFFVLVYVLCEFTAPFSTNMRIYAGIATVFFLWIMGVQYIEVFGSISYLLPMMRHMIADVSSFLVYYWSIQCAYTCAYYLLFKSQGESETFAPYATVLESFITTYLLLLLSHATIVVVMLLNVLIAMMSKTMGAYIEEAKVEATVTFAECVLRMEKTKTFKTSKERLDKAVNGEEYKKHMISVQRTMRREKRNGEERHSLKQ
ncbi:hypothetical protein SDRG_16512 [Saprolegnia diclina VS20]|uniref:Ion transport domain-containing protein n=1 Tax=Saprolegnia diclina (strain VS20) TaxID=1156394 RepID=T0PTQ9_SAPDV|nr:hypothetical protein SDRG_16512 [Saprolegnia diclina VS20]EQC25616.1 hypothetical protein SDRG_16512 [Saprolegnia diclina VS20]|eukprot:XP_008620948.1 hypothetical protein SDRG_16512 [Saprolegnia diclina VS20]